MPLFVRLDGLLFVRAYVCLCLLPNVYCILLTTDGIRAARALITFKVHVDNICDMAFGVFRVLLFLIIVRSLPIRTR